MPIKTGVLQPIQPMMHANMSEGLTMGKYRIKILQIARDDIEELYLYILADHARAVLATAEKILNKN